MNGRPCCARRGLHVASWLAPSALLALLPKCPVCFAAYFALLGVAMPAASASYLRTGLTALCAAALVVLAVRLLLRRARARGRALAAATAQRP